MAENANNFIVNTEYPQDKIVLAYEGEVSTSNPYWRWFDVGGYRVGFIVIPVPEDISIDSVLVDGIWSNDNWQSFSALNGENEYEFGIQVDIGKNLSEYLPGLPDRCILVMADVGTEAVGYFYRLWAFIDENDRASRSEPTSSVIAGNLMKNTTNGVMKIFAQQVLSFRPSARSRTYTHNLGFKPVYMMWEREGDGTWTKAVTTKDGLTGIKSVASDSTIVIDYLGLEENKDILLKVYANGSTI